MDEARKHGLMAHIAGALFNSIKKESAKKGNLLCANGLPILGSSVINPEQCFIYCRDFNNEPSTSSGSSFQSFHVADTPLNIPLTFYTTIVQHCSQNFCDSIEQFSPLVGVTFYAHKTFMARIIHFHYNLP